MLTALRIKNSLDAGSVRKVGDTIGYRVCIIFWKKEMQRRMLIFKFNRVVAVKRKVVALFDGRFRCVTAREGIDVVGRQKKFHRHHKIRIVARQAISRGIRKRVPR